MIELASVRVDHPRGGAPLLLGADLTVGRGEVLLVSGPAGAGGSRLIAALLGDLPLGAGACTLFGRDLQRLRRSSLLRLRRRVGVIPQDLELLGACSALGNVILPLEIDGIPRRAAALRAAELLGRVGLGAELDTPVDRLSMAERQRVAVARALVRNPEVVLADQPTCHQDEAGAADIAALFATCATAGAAVLVLSRDPNLIAAARGLEWRHMFLHDRRIVDARAMRIYDEVADDPIIERIDVDSIDLSVPVEEMQIFESIPVPATGSAPVPMASITPISAAIAAAEAAAPPEVAPAPSTSPPPPPGAVRTDDDAVPNVVPFRATARSRGTR